MTKRLSLITASEEPLPLVMLVDDDELLRILIGAQLEAAGYQVIEADSIDSAIRILGNGEIASRLDAMVLDRGLGSDDGLSLVRQVKTKAEWKQIPVIMLTAYDKPEQTREGLDAGVFYYLGKPVQQPVLISVLARAHQEVVRQRALQSEMRKHRSGFARMESSKFEFSTLEHVEDLSCFVANCFAEPERVLTGIAELMINAIEHGALNIGFEGKGSLLEQGIWRSEIQRRQQSAEYIQKRCEMIFTRRSEGCYVSVLDPGQGFAWRDYLTFDPARANKAHGRGIARASACFDKLAFNEAGNEAVGFIGRESRLTW